MNTYAKGELYWWSLSPFYFNEKYSTGRAFFLDSDGSMYDLSVDSTNHSRPAVSLKSGSVITEGVGTLEKPYIIG